MKEGLEIAVPCLAPAQADDEGEPTLYTDAPDALFAGRLVVVFPAWLDPRSRPYARLTLENQWWHSFTAGRRSLYRIERPAGSGYTTVFSVQNSRTLPAIERRRAEAWKESSIPHSDWPVQEHYLIAFESGQLEFIASGFWMELFDQPPTRQTPFTAHPFAPLPSAAATEERTASGYSYLIVPNGAPDESLLADAAYCAQPLFDFYVRRNGVIMQGPIARERAKQNWHVRKPPGKHWQSLRSR